LIEILGQTVSQSLIKTTKCAFFLHSATRTAQKVAAYEQYRAIIIITISIIKIIIIITISIIKIKIKGERTCAGRYVCAVLRVAVC
jgi:hypothetical protein